MRAAAQRAPAAIGMRRRVRLRAAVALGAAAGAARRCLRLCGLPLRIAGGGAGLDARAGDGLRNLLPGLALCAAPLCRVSSFWAAAGTTATSAMRMAPTSRMRNSCMIGRTASRDARRAALSLAQPRVRANQSSRSGVRTAVTAACKTRRHCKALALRMMPGQPEGTGMLGPDELERYARHIVLREVGGPGQAALRQARVLVDRSRRPRRTGTHLPRGGRRRHARRDRRRHGGAVEPAAAGDPRHAGHRRARRSTSAAAAIRRLNPHVTVETHPTRLDRRQRARSGRPLRHRGGRLGQFRHPLSRVRRLLLREASRWSPRAVGIFDGTLTTIRAHERAADGTPNPTYRCLFPEPPPPGTVPACAEAGILGALTGVIGSMMALEVMREIVGFGEGLVGRLLMVDARVDAVRDARLRVGPGNPLSGERPTITDLSVHA